MSVINKMLRDLDSRQTSASAANAAQHLSRDLIRGTSVLSPRPVDARTKSMWMMPLIGGLILVSVVAGGVLWWQTRNIVPVTTPMAKPVPAVAVIPQAPPAEIDKLAVQQAPATQAMAPSAAAASDAAPVAVAQPDKAPATQAPPSVSSSGSQPVIVAVPVAKPAAPSAQVEAKVVKTEVTPAPPKVTPPDRPAAAIAAKVPLPVPVASSASVLQRQSAAMDALTQAQGLWNAGARDAAVDVLREAISLVQQQGSGGSNPSLIPLAREQSRMLMADNHVSQTLDLLTRLEPALSGQADLWAMRGNAAQRLARHAEAASAYLTALKLRPGEPRWMLGAAISQAILGNMAEANELAEQARLKGSLSPELRTYLRQLGVLIRDN